MSKAEFISVKRKKSNQHILQTSLGNIMHLIFIPVVRCASIVPYRYKPDLLFGFSQGQNQAHRIDFRIKL